MRSRSAAAIWLRRHLLRSSRSSKVVTCIGNKAPAIPWLQLESVNGEEPITRAHAAGLGGGAAGMELRHDVIRIEDEAETALVARQVNDELLRIWIICLTVVLEVGFSEERLLRLAVARFAHGGFEPGGHAFERRVLHRCWLNAAAVKRKSRDGGSRRRKRRRWCPHGFRCLWQVTKHALRAEASFEKGWSNAEELRFACGTGHGPKSSQSSAT